MHSETPVTERESVPFAPLLDFLEERIGVGGLECRVLSLDLQESALTYVDSSIKGNHLQVYRIYYIRDAQAVMVGTVRLKDYDEKGIEVGNARCDASIHLPDEQGNVNHSEPPIKLLYRPINLNGHRQMSRLDEYSATIPFISA